MKTLGSAVAFTDGAGNFVLQQAPPGPNLLFVDGRTASTATAQYPVVETQVTVGATGPSRVPFIIYLPKLDTAHAVSLPLDASGAVTQAVTVTTPKIPGLEIKIPAGVRITGPDGNPVSQIIVTPVPIDRSPMPFPPGVTFPLLFAIHPGGAVPSQPLAITFPNVTEAAPGARFDLYYFDLTAGNWNVWGQGTASNDGTQITPDPGAGLPRFAWHSPYCRTTCPGGTPGGEHHPSGGEPVDLVTGQFTVTKTDLTLAGRLPVTIQRSARSGSAVTNGLMGRSWALGPWETVLRQTGSTFTLVKADQSTYSFTPAGVGQWKSVSTPGLVGAVLTQLAGDFRFQLRLKDGAVQRFERLAGFGDAAGLAALVDRTGNTVTVTRDGMAFSNKIVNITDTAGRQLVFAYDGAGRVQTITDPINRVVRYEYDGSNRLTTVTDPAGGTTRYAYDGSHRITSITDPRNIAFITNEYDGVGRVSRQTQADGGVWTFGYTPATAGVVTATVVTDPRGHATTHRFNSQGLTVSRTDALGQTTVLEYAAGTTLLTATTDPLGRATRFEYDAAGNITKLTDPAGHARTLTYEPVFNKVASLTDPLGNITRLEYDGAGNLTAVVDPLTNRTTLTYNAAGQPLTSTTPLAATTTLTYDSPGNLATVTDPLGNTATRQYDGASRLTRQTDPLGRPTTLAYDALNRVLSVADALGGLTRFTYDGNGNLLTVTDARGNTVTYTYDSMDRMATRRDPEGATETNTYDPAGNLTTRTDRKGQTSTLTYDALNRLTGGLYADGASTSFAYDAVGRVIAAADSVSGTLENGYDTLDRRTSQGTSLGTISYQYDASGRRTQLTAPGQAPVAYGYDAASRLTAITQAPMSPTTAAYDASGRRTRLTLPNGVSTEYQYDVASRLSALTYRNASGVFGDLTYAYDAAGNRTSVGGSFARTLLPGPVASATYNVANRQLTFGDTSLAYDANGNLIFDGTTAYTWDARNRLVSLSGPSAATFRYDVFGRRTTKTVDGARRDFVYDGLDSVLERTDGTTTPYVRTLNIDEAVARGTGEFYLTDALGSVVALTDRAGGVATTYTYEPFGRTTEGGAPSSNPFAFTGREAEASLAVHFYRARYYHPVLQRFIAEDPIELRGGDWNFCAYVGNSPLSFPDPFGLQTGGIGLQLSGAALGAGGSISGGIVVDAQGQVGIAVTTGGGGAGSSSVVSGSLLAQVQGTSAATIQELAGPGATTSLSVQAPGGPFGTGVVGQAEFFTGQGYAGATGGVGLGLPGGAGVTLSGEGTYTWVRCLFNCLDQPAGPLGGRKR